jgi:hypothetical protein
MGLRLTIKKLGRPPVASAGCVAKLGAMWLFSLKIRQIRPSESFVLHWPSIRPIEGHLGLHNANNAHWTSNFPKSACKWLNRVILVAFIGRREHQNRLFLWICSPIELAFETTTPPIEVFLLHLGARGVVWANDLQ